MDEAKKELLIIIPAYNEGKTIGALLEQLERLEVSALADILVMNDASEDETEKIVKARGHMVVNHVYNLGYGCGLQVGYKYAAEKEYRYVIQMDADGQHDACNVERIYRCLKNVDEEGMRPDIVLGSRFMEGSSEYPASLMRKTAWGLFRFLIRLGTGQRIMDPTTGLQGLNRRAFTFYARYNHFDDKYPDANMLTQMMLLGFRVKEIPARMHARAQGNSMHSGLKPVGYMFRMMFSILAVWLRIRVFHMDREVRNEKSAS